MNGMNQLRCNRLWLGHKYELLTGLLIFTLLGNISASVWKIYFAASNIFFNPSHFNRTSWLIAYTLPSAIVATHLLWEQRIGVRVYSVRQLAPIGSEAVIHAADFDRRGMARSGGRGSAGYVSGKLDGRFSIVFSSWSLVLFVHACNSKGVSGILCKRGLS